jgi:hypothetical protein
MPSQSWQYSPPLQTPTPLPTTTAWAAAVSFSAGPIISTQHLDVNQPGREKPRPLGSSVVVFFEGDDCKPSNIMWKGDAFSDEGCTNIGYGSYEIWDLWKVEGMKAP